MHTECLYRDTRLALTQANSDCEHVTGDFEIRKNNINESFRIVTEHFFLVFMYCNVCLHGTVHFGHDQDIIIELPMNRGHNESAQKNQQHQRSPEPCWPACGDRAASYSKAR